MQAHMNQRRRLRASLLFLLPLLFTFVCFNLIPALTGIYAAFTRWNLGSAPVWVGFDNLARLPVRQQLAVLLGTALGPEEHAAVRSLLRAPAHRRAAGACFCDQHALPRAQVLSGDLLSPQPDEPERRNVQLGLHVRYELRPHQRHARPWQVQLDEHHSLQLDRHHLDFRMVGLRREYGDFRRRSSNPPKSTARASGNASSTSPFPASAIR